MSDERATEAKMSVSAVTAPQEGPRYALFIMNARASAALFTLPDDAEVTIGRATECSLCIDDARLSRVHVVVRRRETGLEVVDCGSMNGTSVGNVRLKPNVPHPLEIGDVIALGSSELVLQYAAGAARPRRLWSHGYFEARLQDECTRAAQGGRPFAIARVRVGAGADVARAEKVLAELIRPIDMLASYADREYELLLMERAHNESKALGPELTQRLAGDQIAAEVVVACYPGDGRTAEALIAATATRVEPVVAEGEASVVRTGALARLEPLLARVAAGNISVLVLGETGVGKEVVARMVHERSPRALRPLICLNCASLSESLLESELFGHERGAFTGAVGAKVGLLESASGGTAFLDEIGEMPLALQAKLLRVIEQREILRVGAVTPRPIDVRFVAATNRNLEDEIARERFRLDLYYRLNGFTIVVPPLRERTGEIEPLARHFIRLACKAGGRTALEISPEALSILLAYDWPGNIRELKNVIDRAILLSSGYAILPQHLPLEKMGRVIAAQEERPPPSVRILRRAATADELEATVSRVGDPTLPPPATTPKLPGEDDERTRIVTALERNLWNQTATAKQLGIARQTLVTRMESYNLPRPRKKS
jgi:transcriptional regulator with GAF, ATPase, and Fis domain